MHAATRIVVSALAAFPTALVRPALTTHLIGILTHHTHMSPAVSPSSTAVSPNPHTHTGIVDSGSPHGSRMHRQSMQQSYLKDPEQLPFELNMLEVALGEVRTGACQAAYEQNARGPTVHSLIELWLGHVMQISCLTPRGLRHPWDQSLTLFSTASFRLLVFSMAGR